MTQAREPPAKMSGIWGRPVAAERSQEDEPDVVPRYRHSSLLEIARQHPTALASRATHGRRSNVEAREADFEATSIVDLPRIIDGINAREEKKPKG